MNRPAKKLLFAAIAGTLSASLALTSYAAGLGKLTVNSALGQPLQAEIELVSLQPGDADAISARIASVESYRDAKVEYSPLLRLLRFEINKRTDAKAVIKITSSAPISEPFIQVLVEMSWPSGKVTRDYPILLDPVDYNPNKVNAPQVATVTPRADVPMPAAVPVKPAEVAPVAEPIKRSVDTKPIQAATPVPSATRESKPAGSNNADTYGPVKSGDTLSKIASELKPDSVSLEQMLVALYRENQAAFIDSNMNRLRKGQILRVPSADEIDKISKSEAQKEITVQVAAWKEYREKVADIASTAPAKDTSKDLGAGKISTAKVDLPVPAATSKDILKLSKPEAGTAAATGKNAKSGSAQDRTNALREEAIAHENTIKEAAARQKELEKQIATSQKLMELKAEVAKKQAATVAKVDVPKDAKATAPNVAETKVADAKPAEAPKPATKPKVVPPVPTQQEPDMMAQAMEYAPYAGGVALIGLLVGGFAYVRKRKEVVAARPSAMMGGKSSGLVPDDLKATGDVTTGQGKGGLVDTGNSSFLTDFDKAGPGAIDTDEVDPVAEAEVYIAYGRDTQAEQILQEALGRDKNRHEVSLKLLEIYHARKSATAYETVARELHDAIGGTHPSWAKVQAMGAQIDPSNPLYGGTGQAFDATAAFVAGGDAIVASEAANAMPPEVDFDLGFDDVGATQPEAAETAASVDFDLDMPADDIGAKAVAAVADVSLDAGSDHQANAALDFDLGFEMPSDGMDSEATHAIKPKGSAVAPASFDFDLSSLSLEPPSADTTQKLIVPDLGGVAAAPTANVVTSAMPDISLDLNAGVADSANEGAVATKLELAKAYVEIGDAEGAKEILQEVAREGTAAQQEEASKILSSL